jgi:N-acetylglucosaminyl-diphospho-decaprenol L-rhamnosyltransferase
VIVTYNSATPLRGLVASGDTLRSFSRIVVVDNASTDDTAMIADHAGLEVIRLPRNVGFGAAANVGIAETTGDIVTLLNPDIEICDGTAISSLYRHFSDPQVAVVAPALVLPHGEVQDSARVVPTPANLMRRRLAHRRAGVVQSDRIIDVAWVVGAVMLLRRTAFERVNGFDARYHVYFEDVDLCVRLRREGWVVRLDPTVQLKHQHAAASRKSLLGWSTRQHIRSASLFYRRFPRFLVTAKEGGPR